MSVTLGLLLISTGQVTPSHEQVIAEVVAARRSIQTCYVHFNWTRTFHDRGKTDRRCYETWIDGSKLRIDVLPNQDRPPAEQRYATGRAIKCRNCLGDAIDTICVMPSTGVHSVPRGMTSPAGRADAMFDPRVFGLSEAGIHDPDCTAPTDFLKCPDCTNRSVTVEGTGAGRRVVVSATIPNWGTSRCWIDPSRGWNPTAFEQVGVVLESGEKVWVSHTFELSQDAVSRRWFPSRLVYRETRDGKAYFDEDVDVIAAEVGRPIDPKVFSLAGFGLARGELIYAQNAKGYEYWDGERTVKTPLLGQADVVRSTSTSPPVRVTPNGFGGKWLTVLGAVAAATTGVLLLRRGFRR